MVKYLQKATQKLFRSGVYVLLYFKLDTARAKRARPAHSYFIRLAKARQIHMKSKLDYLDDPTNYSLLVREGFRIRINYLIILNGCVF